MQFDWLYGWNQADLRGSQSGLSQFLPLLRKLKPIGRS